LKYGRVTCMQEHIIKQEWCAWEVALLRRTDELVLGSSSVHFWGKTYLRMITGKCCNPPTPRCHACCPHTIDQLHSWCPDGEWGREADWWLSAILSCRCNFASQATVLLDTLKFWDSFWEFLFQGSWINFGSLEFKVLLTSLVIE